MSALRIARPGQPVVLIDLGPGTPRAFTTKGTIAGEYVTGLPKTPAQREAERMARRADYAARRDRHNEAQRRWRAKRKAA